MSTPDAGNGRQKTQTELEMEVGRKRSERFANLGTRPPQPTVPPQKTNGAAIAVPFSVTAARVPGGAPAEAVPTGLVAASPEAAKPTNAEPAAVHPPEPVAIVPAANALSAGAPAPIEFLQDRTVTHATTAGQQNKQPGPNPSQAKQSATSLPKFDHATALKFYNAVRPSAFILGYTDGRSVTTAEQFETLAHEADSEHDHLFFHVATLKPEWADPATHEAGKVTTASKEKAINLPDGSASHVLECPYLWGDCDAGKYEGTDPEKATVHYEREGIRVAKQVDEGLKRLGITPFAKWRSGAGWQFLIKLDRAIQPNEAETLVGKLHTALGFDPVVRNSNRILRVPGSVNRKSGKGGRVPSPCMPLCLFSTATKVDDVRKALADVAELKPVQPSGVPEVKIDWSNVRTDGGWLRSVDDLPADANPKLRTIVGHRGTLAELNQDLIRAKLLDKPYPSWSEVTLALAASLKVAGYTPEQIAEALLANFPCNEHIANLQNKERAIKRAISRSHSPTQVAIAGVTFRDRDKYGNPKPSLANAVIALRALGIEARFDLFQHRIKVTYQGQAHTIREGLLTDDTVSAARSLINNTYLIDCGDEKTFAAIKEIAFENANDPVLDMLDNFQSKWDGVNRLDRWVVDYLGCLDNPLNRAIGRKVLIAACRRARVPGCKFDTITVLEGVEGTNKSTAIRVLAGDDNFSDQSILGASDKEVQEQLDGVWMHENADLAGMRRADVEHVKAFASRQADRARPAYGRVREDRPRRSIEWGTTNSKEYLQSQTGNRRFWPLETDKIDIEALTRDREQLLGEAATYEAAGGSIMLDQSLWADARDAQEKRRVGDPWEDSLAHMPDFVVHRTGDGFERVASADVLVTVLQIPRAQQNPGHAQRLAHAMEHAGWRRNPGGRVTINGTPVRGYIRPVFGGPTGPTGATGARCASGAHGMTGPTGPSGDAVTFPQMPTELMSAFARAQAAVEFVRSRT